MAESEKEAEYLEQAERIQLHLKKVMAKFMKKPITKKMLKDMQRTIEVNMIALLGVVEKERQYIKFAVHGRVDGGLHVLPANLFTALVFNGVDVSGYNHDWINEQSPKYFVGEMGTYTWYEETEVEHAHAKFVEFKKA